MNKKKRFINGFTNWLFEEYKVPRIPVKVMYGCDAIVDGAKNATATLAGTTEKW